MNPYLIPPLVGTVLNGVLVLWVYSRTGPSLVRRTFLAWNVCLGLWNAGLAVGYALPDVPSATLWYKYLSIFVVRTYVPLFLHFVAAITDTANQPKTRLMLWFAYLSAAFFSVTGIWTSWWMGPAWHYDWGYYPLAGPYEWMFGLTFLIVITYSLGLLKKSIVQAKGYRRNQMKYLLAGTAIYFGGAVTNFLPLYKINTYPIGNFTSSIYSVLVCMAIVDYGLMDIRVVLRRSTAHTLLGGALTMVYLSIVAVLQSVLGKAGVGERYLYDMAAFLMTLLLAPAMKARIDPWVDNAPFWKTYHYTEIIHEYGESILTLLGLRAVAERVIEKMASILLTDSGAVYLRKGPGQKFDLIARWGPQGPALLQESHPVIQHLLSRREELVKEKTLWRSHYVKDDMDDLESIAELEVWPYALALPLMLDGRFLGCVALGEKISGDMFNEDDLNLLRALTKPTAVALKNALSIAEMEERRRAMAEHHDITLLGLLGTEMAHELSKPLTRILNEQTRLTGMTHGESENSLKKIQNEVKRASEIVDGFAMLSPQLPLERTPTPLPELIEKALAVLGIAGDPQVKLIRRYDALPPVPVNVGQISQVLMNIIQNAWEAMGPQGGGSLTLTVSQVRVDYRPMAQISIEDSGPGVPAAIQRKIFEPFFTTKHSQGGRGVGLTLSAAMVKRHAGTLHLESPVSPSGGTRLVIRLSLDPTEETV